MSQVEGVAVVSLQGKKVAFLVAPEGVEQVELTEPWSVVRKGGGQPILVVGGDDKTVQGFNHLDKADTFDADLPVSWAGVEDYDALVLPGGVANPDFLRTQPDAVAFVKGFVETGKPVAAICHAAWTLVEADVVRGRRITSWPSLQTDLRNAGADWVDEQVVIDTNGPGPLISSRNPDDLEAFGNAITDTF